MISSNSTPTLPVRDLSPVTRPKPSWIVEIPPHPQRNKALTICDPRALRSLIAIMDMHAAVGGAASHFGGPSALAELVAVLFAQILDESERAAVPWPQLFHVVNDAGHCENVLYALKASYGMAGLKVADLWQFRGLQSRLTGHGEAHVFPEGVLISNGPLGSSIAPAQGLAFADRLNQSERVTVQIISDGASMEGEAREAFAAIPGLARNGRINPFVMIISDNNTKLSGRIDEEAYSMAPTFAALSELGWRLIPLDDGHNLVAVDRAIAEALATARSNPRQPVAIWAKTIKGYGTQKTMASSSGAHGFPVKSVDELPDFVAEIWSGSAIPDDLSSAINDLVIAAKVKKSSEPSAQNSDMVKSPVVSEKVQAGVSRALIRAHREGLPVFSVSADLPGSTGLHEFQKLAPDWVQDVGVAESNMVGMAAGLSAAGWIPVVDTFSQFGVTKGALPLIMANLSLAPIVAIYSHAGLQDAADGASHQCLTHFAMLSAIPHTDVFALSCSSQAEEFVYQSVKYFAAERRAGRVPRSQIFVLGRENFPARFSEANYQYPQPLVVGEFTVDQNVSATQPRALLIVAVGTMVANALVAGRELARAGIDVKVMDMGCVNRLDVSHFAQHLTASPTHLLTVEDHRSDYGVGGFVVQKLVQAGYLLRAQCLGIGDHFGRSAYVASDLYEQYGLSVSAIVEAGLQLVTNSANEL